MGKTIEYFAGDAFKEISAHPLFAFGVKLFDIFFIVVFTLVIVRLIRFSFNRIIKRRRKKGEENETQIVFIRRIVSGVLYTVGIIGIVYQFDILKSFAISLLAGSGVAAIIIGLASQEAVSNIISGFLITIFRPFKIGDFILVGADKRGTVEDITLRHIIIRTLENKRLVVPNSVINKEIIENSNYIDDKVCNLIEFGIDVNANIDRARFIIKEEILAHVNFYDSGLYDEMGNPDVSIRFVRWEATALILCAYAWAKNIGEGFVMKCDVLESVKKRFDAEGITQPYSQRTMLFKTSFEKTLDK